MAGGGIRLYAPRHMVRTWRLMGLPYHDFGLHVCTIVVLGPFGLGVNRQTAPLRPQNTHTGRSSRLFVCDI